jgi:hypothetical protein
LITLRALALVVDLHRRLDQLHRRAGVAGGADQRDGVLREAGAAVTGAGVQELAADAPVQADAAGHLLYVGADRFAEVGHLVDVGDLQRQEGVGRILDQLAGAAAGEQDRRLVQIERPVELAHDRLGARVLGADYHAVGALEVLDGRAFTQEFRVRDDGDLGVRPHALEDRLDLVAGADRHGRLGDYDGEAIHLARDLFRRRIDVGEVRIAVAAPRRRADADEHRIGLAHRLGRIGAEEQAPGLDVLGDQQVEARFVDRDTARVQALDLRRILVDAGHGVPEVGETGAADQAHIARPDHRHMHQPSLRRMSRRRAFTTPPA